MAAAALVALAGCASDTTAASGQGAKQLASAPDALIQMRRGGCPSARCPVYGVSIFMDGTVVYDGRANVAVVGQRRTKLAAGRLNELIRTIEAVDFLDSPDGCCVCPDVVAKGQLTILDYRPGSVQKTVLHDEACRSVPAALRVLEQAIEAATSVAQWTAPGGGRGASVARAEGGVRSSQPAPRPRRAP